MVWEGEEGCLWGGRDRVSTEFEIRNSKSPRTVVGSPKTALSSALAYAMLTYTVLNKKISENTVGTYSFK